MTTNIKDLDVEIIEEPGTGLPVALCPYCSRGYLAVDVQGGVAEDIDIPRVCKRCGAPMDWDQVHKPGGFADEQAEAAAKAAPRGRRDRMVRQPAVSKSGGKEN